MVGDEESEVGCDIAREAIEGLLGVEDMMKEIQVESTFSVDGEEGRANLSSKGVTINFLARPNTKRNLQIAFEDILTVKPSRSYDTRIESHQLTRSLKLNKFTFGLFKNGVKVFDRSPRPTQGGKQFGFVGSLPDTLTIHYAVHTKDRKRMKLKQVSLRQDDPDVVGRWGTLLAEKLGGQGRPSRLLVFINPFGGKGRGKQLWEEQVAPLCKLAGVSTRLVVTERAGHAQHMLQTVSLAEFDGVISVGGDGMFAEVFNGVLQRSAKDFGVDLDDRDATVPRPGIRVGFIPGGSTDSVAMCLHGSPDPLTAALHILLGDHMQVDAVSIHSSPSSSPPILSPDTSPSHISFPSPSPDSTSTFSTSPDSPTSSTTSPSSKLERFAMTMVSYGYFGDLMKHSESLRWLGRQRYDLSGVRTFLAHRSYKGSIEYTPTSSPSSLLDDSCGQGCPQCFTQPLDGERSPAKEKKEKEMKEKEVKEEKVKVRVEGSFLAITSATVSCSCRHTKPGMSPGAHTGDGATDLIIVRRTHHVNYLRYLVRVAFNRSSPFSLPFVQAVRVTDWSFSDQEIPGRSSVWNCDGEILEQPSLHVRVHRQLVPVFARGVYNKKLSTKMSKEVDLFSTTSDFLVG